MSTWTLLFDISGRVTEHESKTEFITVAGVAIQRDESNIIHDKLKKIPKWKDANSKLAWEVVELLIVNSVQSVSYQVRRTQPAWKKFWDDARSNHDTITKNRMSDSQKIFGPTKPANVIRLDLFTNCSGLLIGLAIRNDKLTKIVDLNGLKHLNLGIALDSDIQGGENQKVYHDSWIKWSKKTNLKNFTNIKPSIDFVNFCTEQQEQLILLPDYLAGIVHYISNPNKVNPPKNITHDDIQKMFNRLVTSSNMTFQQYEFAVEYPLNKLLN